MPAAGSPVGMDCAFDVYRDWGGMRTGLCVGVTLQSYVWENGV